MKTLVMYFSINGHCEKAAKRVQASLACDLAEIKMNTPLKGFMLYFLGGFEAANKKLRPAHVDVDVNQYDKIIIITPVWASSIPAPVRFILNKYSLVSKQLTVMVSAASGKTKKAEMQIKDLFPLSTIIGVSLDKMSDAQLDSLIENLK